MPGRGGSVVRTILARIWGVASGAIDAVDGYTDDSAKIVRRAEYALARARAEQLARELQTMGTAVTPVTPAQAHGSGGGRGWMEPPIVIPMDKG